MSFLVMTTLLHGHDISHSSADCNSSNDGIPEPRYNGIMQSRAADHYRISNDVLSQEVNGETVLLNLTGERYFSLNEVGTRIWQLLNSGQATGEILAVLLDEYDAGEQQLETDLLALLDKLLDAGLLELAAQTSAEHPGHSKESPEQTQHRASSVQHGGTSPATLPRH